MELIIGGIVTYLFGIAVISYLIGKIRPYTAYEDIGDYIATIGWPIVLLLGLIVLPIVLPIIGIIKGIEFVASLGSRHELDKRDRQRAQREAIARVENIEMFEDTVI